MKRLLLFLPVMALGILLVACSNDSEPEPEPETSDIASQLVVLSIIDAAEFHAIDEELNKAGGGEIDPEWLGKVRNGQIAVASIEWPEELAEQAEVFLDAAQQLSITLEADDPALAAAPAKAAHDGWHELSANGWDVLAAEAGVELAEHGDATATATPSGG